MANEAISATHTIRIGGSVRQPVNPGEQSTMIRVLIAEDAPAILDGISGLLQSQADFQIVGAVGNGLEAVEKARELSPHVVIMDAQMPGMDGLQATRLIKESSPTVGILFFTVFTDYLEASMGAGADGYLLKDCDPEDLIAKVRDIAAKMQAAGDPPDM